tara:strand:- start:6721 stop:7263 length:543 start_codon:yes stop_codon:yes gene_type:complete
VKKSQIRKKILEKRSRHIFRNIKINSSKLIKIISAKTSKKKIGLYYPINSEVSTLELINKLRIKEFIVSLPVIGKNFSMEFYQWNEFIPLKINHLGIPEPLKTKKILPSILIVPIVAFDTNLNRLGYGGGFYDRIINKYEAKEKILKIGLALSCQKINKVPTNKFDKKMDIIFTENEVYT